MRLTENEVKKRIVNKLIKWRKWGGSHTENILSGLPSHMKGDKIVKKVLKKLVQDQWLLPAKKTGEIHYALNPRKAGEILQYYEKQSKK